MKRSLIVALEGVLWALFVATACAGPPTESQKIPYHELTVKSLLGGLNSGNDGVEVGADPVDVGPEGLAGCQSADRRCSFALQNRRRPRDIRSKAGGAVR